MRQIIEILLFAMSVFGMITGIACIIAFPITNATYFFTIAWALLAIPTLTDWLK